MSFTRRHLIAAGLVTATLGALGAAGATAAGAAQVAPRTPDLPGRPVVTAAQLTESAGEYGPKGRPPTVGGTSSAVRTPRIAAGLTTYLYGVSSQQATADGMFGTLTVAKPELANGDYHTLAELAAQSADGSQIVEVGWSVDRSINGDQNPHLFVYHWVNGVGACYNGCGFVQASATVKPGMVLTDGQARYFGIEQYQGNWWIRFDTAWVGYFPGSLWNGRFTQLGLAQWFGEVAAGTALPCTDMGTGDFASEPTAASFANIGFFNGPPAKVSVAATNPLWYTAQRTNATGFRFGGPGGC